MSQRASAAGGELSADDLAAATDPSDDPVLAHLCRVRAHPPLPAPTHCCAFLFPIKKKAECAITDRESDAVSAAYPSDVRDQANPLELQLAVACNRVLSAYDTEKVCGRMHLSLQL